MRWAALYRCPPILRGVSASQIRADHAANQARINARYGPALPTGLVLVQWHYRDNIATRDPRGLESFSNGRARTVPFHITLVSLLIVDSSNYAFFQSAIMEYQAGVRSIFRSTIIFSKSAR